MLPTKSITRAVSSRGVIASPFTSCHPAALHVLSPAGVSDTSGNVGASARRAAAIRTAVNTLERPASVAEVPLPTPKTKPLKVVIAGAGIGGLVLAVALLRKGVQVQVLERDFTAIRGEGKYRGPIQIQSNALGALEAIDPDVANEIMGEGCTTGDRINGLCDGLTGEWYVKFDTFHPAVDRGLPITRVISRVSLQQILARAVIKYGGEHCILGECNVTDFSEGVDPTTGREQASVMLEDGRTFSGDLVIGADGIRSKIRRQLIGETSPSYSQYTCYTGISDFTPANIDIVGYRVFLGNGQYFVTSDVGGGKMQWYGFNKEAADGTDVDGTRKTRLLSLFGHWNDNVVDLIKATPEDDILRRDIYDRAPIFTWARGRVALLGDSAHAMQPNLGQGGCMAIEDAYELAGNLSSALERSGGDPAALNVAAVLQDYQRQRILRVSVIHGMAGMAAFMASTYKAYLGEGLGPLSTMTKLGIHHPGRVIGGVVMKATMPGVLDWVLGGNVQHLEKDRVPSCRISDKPRMFDEAQFPVFMASDDAILRAINADWLLLTERASTNAAADANSSSEAKGVYITEAGAVVGASSSSSNGITHLVVAGAGVSAQHARVWKVSRGECMVEDLGSETGTWVNGRRLAAKEAVRLQPGDTLHFGGGVQTGAETYRIKLQHESLKTDALLGHTFSTLLVGQKAADLVAA